MRSDTQIINYNGRDHIITVKYCDLFNRFGSELKSRNLNVKLHRTEINSMIKGNPLPNSAVDHQAYLSNSSTQTHFKSRICNSWLANGFFIHPESAKSFSTTNILEFSHESIYDGRVSSNLSGAQLTGYHKCSISETITPVNSRFQQRWHEVEGTHPGPSFPTLLEVQEFQNFLKQFLLDNKYLYKTNIMLPAYKGVDVEKEIKQVHEKLNNDELIVELAHDLEENEKEEHIQIVTPIVPNKSKIQTKQVFITSDKSEFDTLEAAEAQEYLLSCQQIAEHRNSTYREVQTCKDCTHLDENSKPSSGSNPFSNNTKYCKIYDSKKYHKLVDIHTHICDEFKHKTNVDSKESQVA